MGVELKKKLAWASVHQGKAKFLLFAPKSMYPYCQVSWSNPLAACKQLRIAPGIIELILYGYLFTGCY